MKIKLIFIFLIPIFYSSQNKIDNIEVYYNYTKDYTDSISYPSKLTINNDVVKFDIFFSNVGDDIDSIQKNVQKYIAKGKSLIIKGNDNVFYKKYNSSDFYFTKSIYLNIEYIHEDSLNYKWELGTKFKKILGYNCQNATVKYKDRFWEVYFTKDIPISAGPWKFFGLYGLILEAKSSDDVYSFIAQKITINKPILSNNFEEYNRFIKNKFMTWDEYVKFANQKIINKNKKMQSDYYSGDGDTYISDIETIENEYNITIKEFQKKYGLVE